MMAGGWRSPRLSAPRERGRFRSTPDTSALSEVSPLAFHTIVANHRELGRLAGGPVFSHLDPFMPASPLWIHGLPDALPALASLPQDLVDRRTLEDLLGVGKWTACRVLKHCGAEDGPGGALVCRRDDLV